MFLRVHARVATLIATALLAPAAAAQAAGPSGPTHAQIRAAVKRAEGSRDLWATVNICNTKRYPDVIGIRGQIPSLGFSAQLSMQFQVEYWSARDKRFKPVRGTRQSVSLGTQKRGLHQSGVRVGFGPHAGSLRGTVRFEWRLGSRLIGHANQTTSHGHPSADFGDPPHYSAWKCVIS
jgi:hypothetical protein